MLSAEGKTFYDIGEYMNISPRSIERYAAKLRGLFDGKKISQITAELHKSGWYSIYKDFL